MAKGCTVLGSGCHLRRHVKVSVGVEKNSRKHSDDYRLNLFGKKSSSSYSIKPCLEACTHQKGQFWFQEETSKASAWLMTYLLCKQLLLWKFRYNAWLWSQSVVIWSLQWIVSSTCIHQHLCRHLFLRLGQPPRCKKISQCPPVGKLWLIIDDYF